MNRSNKGASTSVVQILLDILVGSIAFFSSFYLENYDSSERMRCLVIFIVFMFVYILLNKDKQVYNVTSFFYLDRIIKYITRSFLVSNMIIFLVLFYVVNDDSCKVIFSKFFVISYLSFLMEAMIFRVVCKKGNKKHFPRTVYVGDVLAYKQFDYYLKKTNININLLGYIKMDNDEKIRIKNDLFLGNIDNLEKLIREYNIDKVYMITNKNDNIKIQKYVDLCMEMGVTVSIIVDFFDEKNAKSYVSSIGTYPTITYHTISLNKGEKLLKRLFDIVGALIGITIFLPIMIVSAIAIKVSSKGPIIFKQKRVGMNGRVFEMYKFRTMCENAEELRKDLSKQNETRTDLMFKIKNDPRVNTKVGRILRRTSMDEIPQFFNVLKGNMSLVGTRPPTMDEVANYTRSYWRRISIKPGITGMWQVNGRSLVTDFEQVVQLDTKYIDEWNVWIDVKLILKTLCVIFKKDGAY